MEEDDRLLQVYNRELMDLAALVEAPHHLDNPDGTAKAVSPICGSEVTIELALDGNKVVGFGYEIEACALTKAVVAVMKNSILGKSRQEISRAGAALRAMLEGDAPPPGRSGPDINSGAETAPAGDWAGLKILAPVKEYKARHNSILLPFEAAEKAFENHEKRSG